METLAQPVDEATAAACAAHRSCPSSITEEMRANLTTAEATSLPELVRRARLQERSHERPGCPQCHELQVAVQGLLEDSTRSRSYASKGALTAANLVTRGREPCQESRIPCPALSSNSPAAVSGTLEQLSGTAAVDRHL